MAIHYHYKQSQIHSLCHTYQYIIPIPAPEIPKRYTHPSIDIQPSQCGMPLSPLQKRLRHIMMRCAALVTGSCRFESAWEAAASHYDTFLHRFFQLGIFSPINHHDPPLERLCRVSYIDSGKKDSPFGGAGAEPPITFSPSSRRRRRGGSRFYLLQLIGSGCNEAKLCAIRLFLVVH
jgi:hypothetical protein